MLKARDLVNMSIDEVWELPDGPMKLQFDDGVIETTTRETIFSRYTWEIHRHYPKTPILKHHHIGDERLNANTTLRLLGNGLWDTQAAYNLPGGEPLEPLSRMCYEISNQMYNRFTAALGAYVGSISIIDFIEVMMHPKIMEAMQKLRESGDMSDGGIEKAYAIIKAVLLDSNELINNGVAKAAKSGLVSIGQILQCVGPRGLTTDIDSHIFRRPIMNGFAYGLTSLEDSMKESRSSAKALFFAKDPMAQSEYFNRNMQLSAAVLSNLHQTDCGSQDYIPFMVKPGDLPCLDGMWFLDEQIGKTRPIYRSDKHLIGKTIQMRSVFTCKHPDPYGVCQKCFGELGLSVPAFTNIGHLSSSELLSQVAQRILSTKHEDGSANVEPLQLDEFEQRYLKIGSNKNQLHIAESLIGKKFYVYFPVEEAITLADVVHVDNVKKLTPTRISEISIIQMEFPTKGGAPESVPLTVSTSTRMSSLTWEALDYIKKHGWTVGDDERYCIDMSHWKKGQPFLELPMKHFSTVDYMFQIGALIKGSGGKKGGQSLKNFEDVSAALTALHELVNSKLQVNISHLQTIILTMMVRDEENRDYRMPVNRLRGEFARYKQIMARRSLAAAMAFQNQTEIIYSFESFNIKDRPPSPLDYLMVP